MENNRRRDGRSEHNANERTNTSKGREALPKEFEGMNFEQQRGSYKNSDGGGCAEQEERRENKERRNDF
jgi:hypothetical protein